MIHQAIFYQISLLLCHIALITAHYFDDVNLTISNDTQFVSIYGPDATHTFGYSVSSAGDFNDDGIADVLVGAPGGGSSEGTVYLIYGSKDGVPSLDLTTPLTSTQGIKIEGEVAGDYLGCAVGSADDFNGDGIADIILGAPYMTPGGAAYIIFGSKTPMTSMSLSSDLAGRGFRISGNLTGGLFGLPVTRAGDVNGDGLGDVIIGAFGQYFNGPASGSVYVIFGRRTGIIDITVPGDLTSDRGFYIVGKPSETLGFSVGAAGDVNGDGIDDIIVGELAADKGEAYIIYGRKTGFTNYNLSLTYIATDISRITGNTTGQYFGSTVNKAGDINGDGIGDILIGARSWGAPGRIGAGAAYVIFGKKNGVMEMDMATDFDSSQGFVIYGAENSDALGVSLSSVGDFNGDRVDDILVAAAGASIPGKSSIGALYIIYGNRTNHSDVDVANLEESKGFKIQGTSAVSTLGFSLGCAGDVNGDSAPDVIVASPWNDNPVGLKTGSAFVLFGVPAPYVSPDPPVDSSDDPDSNPKPDLIIEVQSAGAFANAAAATVLFFGTINNALPLLFTFLVDILFYVRYLQILYPPRLRYMLEQPNPEYISIDYITSAPDQLEEYLAIREIPDKFEFYEFHSSFLVNFWPSLIMFLIVFVITMIVLLLEYATRSKKWLNEKCLKFKQSMKWNYLIAMFTGYFSDIALHTFLETRAVQFESFLEVLSFMICLFVNFLAAFMLLQMFFILKKLRVAQEEVKTKKTQPPEHLEKLKTRFEAFEVIFNSYKDESFLQQSYLFLFSLRLYLFYMIVGYLFAHPIVQTSIISIMGLVVLIYVIMKRPFQDKKHFIMSVIQESILQVVNISAFVLAVTDNGRNETDKVRVVFGDIIIGCNIAFMLVGLGYTIIMLTLMFIDFYKFIKKKLEEKKLKKELSIHNAKVKPSRDLSQLESMANPNNDITPIDDSQYALNASSVIYPNSSSPTADIHLTEVAPQDVSVHSRQKRLGKPNRLGLAFHYQLDILSMSPSRVQEDQSSVLHPKDEGTYQTLFSLHPETTSPQELLNSKNMPVTPEYISNIDISGHDQLKTTKPKEMSLYYRREKALRKI